MHAQPIWPARLIRSLGILAVAVLIWTGTRSSTPVPPTAPPRADYWWAQGVKAVFFPVGGGFPWIRLGVEDARSERLKVGFLRVGLVPVLALRQVSLDIDLLHFEATTARSWLQDDFANLNPRRLQVGPIRITLRRGNNIVWECTATEAAPDHAEGFILRQVVVRADSGAMISAASARITLAPPGNQLRVEMSPPGGHPIVWDFALPKVQN